MKSPTYPLMIASVLYFSPLVHHPSNLSVMQFKLIRDQNNLRSSSPVCKIHCISLSILKIHLSDGELA